jgi:hypothetical protein
MSEQSDGRRKTVRRNLLVLSKGRRKGRKCRCSLRHISDPDHEKHGCPGRVYGYGPTLGQCQENAMQKTPVACRRYYGHCSWV